MRSPVASANSVETIRTWPDLRRSVTARPYPSDHCKRVDLPQCARRATDIQPSNVEKYMHKRIPVVAIALLLAACATSRGPAAEREHERVGQHVEAWDQAIVAKDRAAVAANMSDDFVQIDSYGRRSDKAAFLDGILSPDLRIDPYTVEDLQIRLYGATAVVNGATDMTGSYRGKPFRTHYRFTDTYVKQDGVWRVVNVQTTEIAE